MKELDEAIYHCLEVAKEQEEEAKADNEYSEACMECAAEHRWLAEQLKELKASRKLIEGYGMHYHEGRFYSTKAYNELVEGERR